MFQTKASSSSRSHTYRILFPVETHSSAFRSVTAHTVPYVLEFLMSSTHTFVDDVFISYRHLDNELLDEEGKGWIDNFHERFESVLGAALGYEPHIWRDPRLPRHAYSADVLDQRIKKTAARLPSLSAG